MIEVMLPYDEHVPSDARIIWRIRQIQEEQASAYHLDMKKASIAGGTEDLFRAGAFIIHQIALGWTNVVDDCGNRTPLSQDALQCLTPQSIWLIAAQLVQAAAPSNGSTRQGWRWSLPKWLSRRAGTE